MFNIQLPEFFAFVAPSEALVSSHVHNRTFKLAKTFRDAHINVFVAQVMYKAFVSSHMHVHVFSDC